VLLEPRTTVGGSGAEGAAWPSAAGWLFDTRLSEPSKLLIGSEICIDSSSSERGSSPRRLPCCAIWFARNLQRDMNGDKHASATLSDKILDKPVAVVNGPCCRACLKTLADSNLHTRTQGRAVTPSEFQRSLTSLPQSRTGLACLALGHWPLTSGHSPLAARRSPLATACVLWLRFRLAGSGTDGSTSSGNEFCVDSGLASFGAFCGARHSSCVGSLLPPDSLATDDWPLATDDWPLATVSGSPSPQPTGADRCSLQIHWPLVTGHWPLFPRPASHATRHQPTRQNQLRSPARFRLGSS